MENIDSFQTRLDDHFVLDHHDIGFYIAYPPVRATRSLAMNTASKKSFKQQMFCWHGFKKGEFIQAWGTYGDPQEYRLIIDSLLNLPLLFAATQLSGKTRYAEAASKHYQTVRNTVIKNDATTFHTYYFDPETGQPSHGATHQGNSDQSIWARGQSWAILGLPLNESYLHSQPFPENYPQIVEVFLAHLPADLVPYWDFDFNDQHPAEKTAQL